MRNSSRSNKGEEYVEGAPPVWDLFVGLVLFKRPEREYIGRQGDIKKAVFRKR